MSIGLAMVICTVIVLATLRPEFRTFLMRVGKIGAVLAILGGVGFMGWAYYQDRQGVFAQEGARQLEQERSDRVSACIARMKPTLTKRRDAFDQLAAENELEMTCGRNPDLQPWDILSQTPTRDRKSTN